jgi:hypothetical protein
MSAVWRFFTRTAEDKTRATCHSCKKLFAVPGGGTTSSLKNHLKNMHPDLFTELEEQTMIITCFRALLSTFNNICSSGWGQLRRNYSRIFVAISTNILEYSK